MDKQTLWVMVVGMATIVLFILLIVALNEKGWL